MRSVVIRFFILLGLFIPALALADSVVEFYNANINHYFMTASSDEAVALDNKPAWGWARTGKTLDVWLTQTTAPSNASPVCRFFGVFSNGTVGSHFYTADPAECAYVKGRLDWGWGYENDAFYAVQPTGSTCPSGTSPVYRVFNNGIGGAPNHRYMANQADVFTMVAQGWVSEGSGTAFCGIAGPSIALTLTDNTSPFVARSSLASSSPARVTATVTNANGTVVPGVIVVFSTSDPRDTFSGGANTALTNASGVATVTLTTSNTSGSGVSTVTANTTVNGITATNYLNYGIGSITLSALTFPSATLSAYGTASVSVNVLNNGGPFTSPMKVSFTSTCAATGKATLTSAVTTRSQYINGMVHGTATANYLDNGCNNSFPGDTITATLMNGVTSTGNLPVGSPALGSIRFFSVVTNPATTPTMITLKGTGGVNRSETARVTFRVVDTAGNPLGNALVNFSLNTTLGGLSLSSTSATSDPITGNVVTNVNSGAFSTAVRVTATTGSLYTQSDQILISTGIPSQDGISLSASPHNIEGWRIDGVGTTLTARLADHFHNPVPDGTTVYFTSEGGSIVPSCITVGGVCTTVLTSQEPHPISATNGYGRVTVLARAIGEEAFIDLNGNGTADWGEMIDDNFQSTDMGEAYVDYNENKCRDPGSEPYIDSSGNGIYDGKNCGLSSVSEPGGDGLYNGVLCTAGNSICSTQKSIDVRGSQVIIFSDSFAASLPTVHSVAPALLTTFPFSIPGAPPTVVPNPLVLTSCLNTPGSQAIPTTVTVTIVDSNGNAMPVGTQIDFSTNNGTIPTPANWIVPDTIGCRTGFAGCPDSVATSTFGDIPVTLTGTCTNTKNNGSFFVKVTSPTGVVSSSYTMSIAESITEAPAPAPTLTLSSVACFISCSSETVLSWPYSASSTASASVMCVGNGCSSYYDVASFNLTASGQSFTITNLKATGSSVTPLFSGLSNGQTIKNGETVAFKLQSPFTHGATANLTYSFTVLETNQTFRYTVQLQTN